MLESMFKAICDQLDGLLHRVHINTDALLVLGLSLMFLLYSTQGSPVPPAEWDWMDIFAEGGLALMAALWASLIARCRPGGRVTMLLVGGLGALMLGSWADGLDEVFFIPDDIWWGSVIESGIGVAGVVMLTLGLWDWRQEQFRITEHLDRRERLFRDHRALDRTTQLANADYLRRQLRLEHHRAPSEPCALVMLDIDRFHLVNREHGAREGDRVLEVIGQMLLLNLRSGDLLCRYAGDRFAMLLPGTTESHANELAEHLANVLKICRVHTRQGVRLQLSARVACAVAHTDPDVLIDRLNAIIEATAPTESLVSAAQPVSS